MSIRFSVNVVVPLCLLLMLSMLTGCDQGPPDYSGRGTGVTVDLTFPADWDKQRDYQGLALIGLSPAAGPSDTFQENINIVIEPLPSAMTATQYTDTATGSLDKMLQNPRIVSRESVKVGPYDAERLVYTHRMAGMSLKVLAYLITEDRVGFVLTCSATAGSYDQFESQFESICQTFDVQKAKP